MWTDRNDASGWQVPAVDSANLAFVRWDAEFGGFFLYTRPPEDEGRAYPTDGYATLAELMVATAPVVEWQDVPAETLRQILAEPQAAFIRSPHESWQERIAAEALARAA